MLNLFIYFKINFDEILIASRIQVYNSLTCKFKINVDRLNQDKKKKKKNSPSFKDPQLCLWAFFSFQLLGFQVCRS